MRDYLPMFLPMNIVLIIVLTILVSLLPRAHLFPNMRIEAPGTEQVLVLTDIHLSPRQENPKYPYGRFGADSPYSLVHLSIAKSREILPTPSYILVSGDMVGHSYNANSPNNIDPAKYKKFQGVLENATNELVSAFPTTPMVFCIGNHDVYVRSQVPKAGSQFKREYYDWLYATWISNIPGNGQMDTAENRLSFSVGGYYYGDVGDNLRVLSLNTNLWSGENPQSNDPEAAEAQMYWLEQQLVRAETNNYEVIILLHEPYGKFLSPWGMQDFWWDSFLARYKSILVAHSDHVTITLCGHMHVSDIKVNVGELPITNLFSPQDLFNNLIVNRAISPLLPNNPGITIYTFDSQSHLPLYLEEYTFPLMETYNKQLTHQEALNLWTYYINSRATLGITDLSRQGIWNFLLTLTNLFKLVKYQVIRLGWLFYKYIPPYWENTLGGNFLGPHAFHCFPLEHDCSHFQWLTNIIDVLHYLFIY